MTALRILGWQIMSASTKKLTMTVKTIHLSDLVYVTMFNVWTLIYILFICSEIVRYSTSDNESAECKDLPDVFTFDLYPWQTLTKLKKGDRLLSSILISFKTINSLTKEEDNNCRKMPGVQTHPIILLFLWCSTCNNNWSTPDYYSYYSIIIFIETHTKNSLVLVRCTFWPKI